MKMADYHIYIYVRSEIVEQHTSMGKNKKMACEKRKKKRMKMAAADQVDFESGLSDLLKEMNGIPHDAKEIFLRELVLNAARGLVQLRLDTLYEQGFEFEYGAPTPRGLNIHIIPDKSNNTLSIVDNGIGMNKAGLRALLSSDVYRMNCAKKLCGSGGGQVDSFYDSDCDLSLGFPSVFLVADSVEVTTQHYESDKYKPCKLFCSASDKYFVVEDANTYSTPRGTKVTLQLNKDHFEYLDLARLNKLIDKYPMDLCHYPVSICSPAGNIIGTRRADVEDKKKRMKVLMKEFKGLDKLFARKLVGRKQYLKDVVLSQSYPDIPAVLSIDKETLHLSPRGTMMANLKFDAELNPDDEQVEARIDLLHMAALNNIEFYEEKHETDNMRWEE